MFENLFQEQQDLEDAFALDYISIDRSEDPELFKEANSTHKKLKARRKILEKFRRLLSRSDCEDNLSYIGKLKDVRGF